MAVAVEDTPEKLNLGCGHEALDGYHNVDIVDTPAADEILDLEDMPWPWPDESVREIRMSHVIEHLADPATVLSECARVLQPGGTLEVLTPIGMDHRADPDHESEWVWDTPEMFTGTRHWDVDLPLTVIDRDIDLWSHWGGHIDPLLERYLAWRVRTVGLGRWCFDVPGTSGEFRILFRRDRV